MEGSLPYWAAEEGEECRSSQAEEEGVGLLLHHATWELMLAFVSQVEEVVVVATCLMFLGGEEEGEEKKVALEQLKTDSILVKLN